MSIAEALECTIDFEGQKLVDRLTHVLLIVSGVLSFIAGYSTESVKNLLIVFSIGLTLTTLIVIPPWPIYNKHPEPFIQQDTKINIETK